MYTDEQLEFIQNQRKAGNEWDEIREHFNHRFDTKKSANALKKQYYKLVESQTDLVSDDVCVKNLKTTHSARKNASKLRQENKVLVEHQLTLDEFLEKFEGILKSAKLKKISIPKKPKSTKKTKMVVEPLLSDIHYGLETKSYNAEVARRRVRYYAETVVKEIRRKEKTYNIEKIHLPLLADFLQSATMHKDSGQSCHLTNAEQLAVAIESLFYDFVLPIAETGYPIEITGLCGNHDREAEKQHTVNPGKTYFTYTMYRMLEMLCQQTGLKKVSIDIPNGVYRVVEILGKSFLYEHGHVIKGSTIDSLEKHLIKRQAQVGEILSGVRIGHYHNDRISNMGRHIINASTVTDDHYGDLLGYKSRPGQVLNFYVDCKRDTSYFHSITVDLSEVK